MVKGVDETNQAQTMKTDMHAIKKQKLFRYISGFSSTQV